MKKSKKKQEFELAKRKALQSGVWCSKPLPSVSKLSDKKAMDELAEFLEGRDLNADTVGVVVGIITTNLSVSVMKKALKNAKGKK